MLKRKSDIKITLLMVLGIFFFSSQVFSATLGPLVQVSSVSPFGDLDECGDFPGIFNGINFVDSEVEPWVGR